MEWREKLGDAPQICPQKALKNRFIQKMMLTLFFDSQGMIHMEFLPPNTTISAEEFCLTLDRFKEAVCRKCLHLWKKEAGEHWRPLWLHMDNARPHTAIDCVVKFHQSSIQLLPHPPYSPNLAPCDFWAFPILKKQLRGRCFANKNEVQEEVRHLFRQTPAAEYSHAIHKLVSRWNKCVQARGGYFKGC